MEGEERAEKSRKCRKRTIKSHIHKVLLQVRGRTSLFTAPTLFASVCPSNSCICLHSPSITQAVRRWSYFAKRFVLLLDWGPNLTNIWKNNLA